jgi:glutathione S-transferase
MSTTHPLPAQPIRLFHHPLSGHVHRVELFLSLLGLPFDKVPVDFLEGEHRRREFLARNPFGQLPVIEDGDATVADSNAILVYLARRYDASGAWLPADALGAARVQRWFSIAAGPLASGPAAARVAVLFGRPRDPAQAQTAQKLFAVMEAHLAREAFLAGAAPTLADVSLYTYTAHAPEGGIPLDAYPNLRAWLLRIEALPGFIGMQRSPAAEPLAVA